MKLRLVYADRAGVVSERVVWPLLIAYLDASHYIVGWCETRQGYRHFRTDRVHELVSMEEKYPDRRAVLLKVWEEETKQRMPYAPQC